MNEMIERVARVLCEAKCRTLNCRCGAWELHENTARDSIAAMREPTEDMLRQGAIAQFEDAKIKELAAHTWRIMIDASLD